MADEPGAFSAQTIMILVRLALKVMLSRNAGAGMIWFIPREKWRSEGAIGKSVDKGQGLTAQASPISCLTVAAWVKISKCL